MREEIKYKKAALLGIVLVPILIASSGLIYLFYRYPGSVYPIIAATIFSPILFLGLLSTVISLLEGRAIIIDNDNVKLGFFMGRLQFNLKEIESAVVDENNLYLMDHILVKLKNENEWRYHLDRWKRFCVWSNNAFYKSSVVIPSYLLNANANQVCEWLQPLQKQE